jgi:hypothetical protein
MTTTRVQILGVAIAMAALTITAFSEDAAPVQTFPLTDTKALALKGVMVEAVEYKGRKAVRLTRDNEDEGYAVVAGTDFQDGTIEVDLAVKIAASFGAP